MKADTPNLLYLTKNLTVDLNKIQKGEIYPNKAAFCKQLGVNYQNTVQMSQLNKYVKLEKTGNGCEVRISSIKEGITTPPCITTKKKIIPIPETSSKPFYCIKRRDRFLNMKELLTTIGLKDNSRNRVLVKQHVRYKKQGNTIYVTDIYDKDCLLDGFKQESNAFIFYKELIRFLSRGDNLNKAYTIEEIRDKCFNPDCIFESKKWKKYEKEHPEDKAEIFKLKTEISSYAYVFVYDKLRYLQSMGKINWMNKMSGLNQDNEILELPIVLEQEITQKQQDLAREWGIHSNNYNSFFTKSYHSYLKTFKQYLQEKHGLTKIKKRRLFMFETNTRLPRISPFDKESWTQKIITTKFEENPVFARVFE